MALFETASTASTSPDLHTSQWSVVYTRPRHEKRVAEELGYRNVKHFLPLYRKASRWKDRVAQVLLPLFPGYIFLCADPHDRFRALEVPGVVRYISANGRPVVVPDSEIERLQLCASDPGMIFPHPWLATGQRVRVKAGAFVGLVGTLARETKENVLVVSVDHIERSFALHLHEVDLEPLSPEASSRYTM